MKKAMMKSILSVALSLILCLGCFTACGQNSTPAPENTNTAVELASGGTLYLKVNPEIAIDYDDLGMVTGVTARNNDALTILADYSGFEGKTCKEVVSELVTAIGNAGYFIEEIEGERRQITIEIESGSRLPHDNFLNEVAEQVRSTVNSNNWQSPLNMTGFTDYGMTDYIDTDYGPNNDGITDYIDTDYGPNNDGITDYIDTDYGPNNDGITDYIDTDYGPNNDGITDYNDTDYGPNNDGITDYIDTDYGPNNDGITDYIDTDYGPNNDGITDYNDTDYGPNNDGITDYNDTDYGPNNDGITDYDDTDYGSSSYGDSRYD